MQFDPNSDPEFELTPNSDPIVPEESLPQLPEEPVFQLPEKTTEEVSLPEETTEEVPLPEEPQPSGAFASEEVIENSEYRGRFSHLEETLPELQPEQTPEEPQEDPELLELRKLSEETHEEQLPLLEQPKEKPAERKPRMRAVKKGRPRRKKGEGLFGIPNILVTVVWCALTLLISVTLGRLVWVCAAEVLAFGREDKTVTVTIYDYDTIDDITRKLAREELIHFPGLFKLYARFAVDEGEIRPGIWELNTKYDYHALVKMMSPSSSRDVVKVTIPEGYTCRQIFALLEENKICTVQDISSYAANGQLDNYWFLENVTRGDPYCLEGFLFPDTYEFYQNDTPKNVLSRMLNNFNNRFDENMRAKIQLLNIHLSDLMSRNGSSQEFINAHQFDVRDVVNVAAMIEKETSSAQEGYQIASVIYNRLFCWRDNPPYLNIDATIVYALEGKTNLTLEDLRVDSPFNTYTNQGLPPHAIANPGLTSLQAALEPVDDRYYFYILNPATGHHEFSATREEHEALRASFGG